MKHLHYYKIAARTHFELGYTLGKLFKSPSLSTYNVILSKMLSVPSLLEKSGLYLKISKEYFPRYIEELEGYAKGMGVDFHLFWLTFLNEEFDVYPDKCTSCYAANGQLVGHNEDFDDHYKKRITILEKTIGGVTIFELFYYNGLGGTAASVNSFGFTQTVNTLNHTNEQIGVPRNMIARWLSETKDPEGDFQKLKKIPRSLGYNHTFSFTNGKVWNIESTAKDVRLTTPAIPYVHTNHYLTDLKREEADTPTTSSHERYNYATSQIGAVLNKSGMKKMLEKTSGLEHDKKKNNTIARFIVDRALNSVDIWLKREEQKGWIAYSIPHI